MGRIGLLILVLAGCRGVATSSNYPEDLWHPNYVKRSQAVARFATTQDESQLPDAFALLMDNEAHIRAMAHDAIKAMSPGGKDFGYRSYLSDVVRIGIVERWKAWWMAERQGHGQEASGG